MRCGLLRLAIKEDWEPEKDEESFWAVSGPILEIRAGEEVCLPRTF